MPEVGFANSLLQLSAQARYTPSSWYYDHSHPVRYEDLYIKGDLRMKLGGLGHGVFGMEYDNVFDPSGLVRCGFVRRDSVSEAGVVGAVYSDYQAGFEMFGNVMLRDQWCCSLMVARDYHRKSRSYHFFQNDTLVLYKPTSLNRYVVAASLGWKNESFFPAVFPKTPD